jgi:GGDEF domain-containing protein
VNHPSLIQPINLERRELQLSVFVCAAIVILSAGLAVLMYPAVFSNQAGSVNRTPRIAFYGFCVLSSLLVAYIANRQILVRHLRHQMSEDRTHAVAAQERASGDLLKTLPNFASLQDRLPMEFRRAAATEQELSILVVVLQWGKKDLAPSKAKATLGESANAISKKLREQDSIYLMGPSSFGIILPGVRTLGARAVSARIAEGLTEVAGANKSFFFTIKIINYPEHATTAHDLENAVRGSVPEDDLKPVLQTEVLN